MHPDELADATAEQIVPRLRGLFVGVDRYESPRIPNLASAVRDAAALHALFEDNLGGNTVRLLDQDATRDRLVTELDVLTETASPDDVVVITFSGHGTDTHELVTYDADPADFAGSCLLLDDLTERVSAIPARQLVVVLDCCFSGGAGAKVLHAQYQPRGSVSGGALLSTAARLDQLAGRGRLILTASTADQPAYEDPVLGHGLLTYHLLQRCLGRRAWSKRAGSRSTPSWPTSPRGSSPPRQAPWPRVRSRRCAASWTARPLGRSSRPARGSGNCSQSGRRLR
ncbi:caspase family protein [Amycolatopsis tolypomycina]|uniref:caspase family protein n=1 Tax=Amycolatopsis tolypomycina TaxID=208445 RepID=UPI000AC4A93F|nr:caspase family protein [Amycolatopsis tolypomycina]